MRVPALQVSLSLTWSSVTGSGSGIQLGLVSEFGGPLMIAAALREVSFKLLCVYMYLRNKGKSA